MKPNLPIMEPDEKLVLLDGHRVPELSVAQIKTFRDFKKTAIVLMLINVLDRPVSEQDIAAVFGMHPQTARAYLKILAKNAKITRAGRYKGWILTDGGRQMLLPGKPVDKPVENFLEDPANATFSPSNAKKSRSPEDSLKPPPLSFNYKGDIVGEGTRKTNAKKSRSPETNAKKSRSREDPDLVAALEAAGIQRNHRTQPLFKSSHLTPAHVTLNKEILDTKYNDSEPYIGIGGLLISVLERTRPGQPPPSIRHKHDCQCANCCQKYRLSSSEWND